jgi:hypothetical protein
VGKTHITAPETMGLTKTTLRQATAHRDPTVRKQEMLGNDSQTISGRCRKNRDGGHSDSDHTNGLRTGVG